MCLLSLPAKNLNLWWHDRCVCSSFSKIFHELRDVLFLCLEYGSIWADVVPASLLRRYPISLSSGFFSQIFLHSAQSLLNWMYAETVSLFKIEHTEATVSLPLFCTNMLSLCSLDFFLESFALLSKHRMAFLCRFLCPKHKSHTNILFLLFSAQIYHLSVLLNSFSNTFALVSKLGTVMLWFCSATFAQNRFESDDGVSESVLRKYTTLHPLGLLS